MQQLHPQLILTGWRSRRYHRCRLCICRGLCRPHRLRGWGHRGDGPRNRLHIMCGTVKPVYLLAERLHDSGGVGGDI